MIEFLVLNRGQVELIDPYQKYIIIGATEPNRIKPIVKKNGFYVSDLRLYYSDIESNDIQKDVPGYLFSIDQARLILSFWKRYKDQISLCICQCDGGICRSSAMAAALTVIEYGQRSDQWLFKAPYNPNMHVYRTLLNTYFGEQNGEEKE